MQGKNHSKRVKRLRIILPVMSVVFSIGILLLSIENTRFSLSIPLDLTNIDNNKIMMKGPKISGYNNDGSHYTMHAGKAFYDISNPNYVIMKDIEASLPIKNTNRAHLIAASANFDRVQDVLNITVPFTLNLENNIRINFNSATFYIKKTALETKSPLSVFSSYGSIFAQSFNTKDKGHVMIFSGNVKMLIEPRVLQKEKNEKRILK
ncbi:hypothetical protein B488_13020 [Liberibacter crescens BT-1]|uniref:LPS export ABC transporter periplasmic protein LptC n=2 Tax=Liberibacter crescens TaxID=1273132 RepID=L0EUR4_LIBCB|nr:hypothetical protein B488_13020 [Liberibacter crescens BT-1]AMC13227.1 hypothetical protein RL73_06585 [Liberibacter crescens]